VATRYDKLAETFLGFVCLAILFTLRLTMMIYKHALARISIGVNS